MDLLMCHWFDNDRFFRKFIFNADWASFRRKTWCETTMKWMATVYMTVSILTTTALAMPLSPSAGHPLVRGHPQMVLTQSTPEPESGIATMQENLGILGLYGGPEDGIENEELRVAVGRFLALIGQPSGPYERYEHQLLWAAAQILQAGDADLEEAIRFAPELLAAHDVWDDSLAAYENGNLIEAERLQRQIVDAFERFHVQNDPNTLLAMNNFSNTLLALGRYAEAEAYARRAFIGHRDVFGLDDPGTMAILGNLSNALQQLGRNAEAEAAVRQILEFERRTLPLDDPEALSTLRTLATSLLDQQRFAEAEAILRRVLTLQDVVHGPGHLETLITAQNLAISLSGQNRFSEARVFSQRALEGFTAVLGAEHSHTLSTAMTLASITLQEGDLATARELYTVIVATSGRVQGFDHPFTLGAVDNLALVLSEVGQHDQAIGFGQRLLADRQRVLGSGHPDTIRSINNLALAYQAAGDRHGVIHTLSLALDLLPSYFSSNGASNVPERTAALPLNMASFFDTVEIADREGILSKAQVAALTFELNGWLSFGPLDVAMSDLGDRLTLPPGPERDALRRFQEAETAVAQARAAFRSSGRMGLGDDTPAYPIEELRAAEQAFETAQDEIQAYPRLADLELPRPLRVAEAQTLLQPNEAMLSTAIMEEDGVDHIHVWLVTQAGVTWRTLFIEAGGVAAMVDSLRGSVDLARPSVPLRHEECGLSTDAPGLEDRPFDLCSARAIHDWLFSDLLNAGTLDGIDHLIIVPDGPLQQIPFGFLVTDLRSSGEYRWLIEDFALTTLPNTASLRVLRSDEPERDPDRTPFLGIAPVEFSEDPALRDDLGRAPSDLPGTETEVLNIATLTGSDPGGVLLRDDATEYALRARDLRSYDLVSFATHAWLGNETAQATGGRIDEPALVLRSGNGHDGILTASEAATLRLDADLVFLSGCNTAAGGARDAEGLSGLARAFFFAGARSLMVSHWYVEDRSATRLMTETVNRSLEQGISRSEALRAATLSILRDPDAGYRHPFFWAPFVLVGEGGLIQ
jgi:CHAT domain-containing protein/tetratricopeptide (TPR) repeat protein